jgi:hypothetical protein
MWSASIRKWDAMNLQQSDAELRLQMQQINAAEAARGGREPNPFAAAFGISAIVLLVWTLFALGALIGRLISFAHEATDCAASIFSAIHRLGPTSPKGSATVALTLSAVAFGFHGGRVVLRKGKTIASSIRRPRA